MLISRKTSRLILCFAFFDNLPWKSSVKYSSKIKIVYVRTFSSASYFARRARSLISLIYEWSDDNFNLSPWLEGDGLKQSLISYNK